MDLIEYFKLDPDYQDINEELNVIKTNLVTSGQLEHYQGGIKKSPLTTPFPSKDMRELPDIKNRRNVTRPEMPG